MESTTLDDFMALNDQLAALIAAGVPLNIELGEGADAAATLERINAAIARRVSQGATLTEALAQDDPLLTPSYRCLLQLGLRDGGLTSALDSATRLAGDEVDAWQIMRSSLVYPIIVCCLAYAGLVLFCFLFVPKLESMFQSMRISPGSGLRLLQTLRNTLPFWIAVPPAALLLVWGWQKTNSQRRSSRGEAAAGTSWLPGLSRTAFQQRCASFAESLASLLEGGMPMEEGLRIASGAWNDSAMSEELRRQAAAVNQGRVPDDSSLVMRLPPFLRWALWQSDATTGRARALRMAASIYRQSAERRQERLRNSAPLVLCVIIGGGVTLLYGLALFVPVVEMLRGLAS